MATPPEIDSVHRLDDRDGRQVFEERGEFGPIRYLVEKREPPRLLVMRITDNSAFGGTWTYEVAPASAGSRLTITEDGEIYNPFFRFFARFVFGYEGTLESYLAAVHAELGDS